MPKYGMVIDIAKCNGCYSCMLTCKDEHCGHEYPGYTSAQPMTGQFWLNLIEKERGSYPKIKLSYTPIACMHCRNAPCISQAENNAVYRRKDGIVIIDPDKAKGQKQLVSACPYRVIFWNEEQDVPQKCTLCAHLLDEGWKVPRCVEVCPTGSLIFGDLDDPESEVSKLLASSDCESLQPAYELEERVVYLNVPKKFIAGTVVFGDSDECAKNVKVTLTNSESNQEVTTDGFGDFWFEQLESNKEYTLVFEASGYKPTTLSAQTKNDANLGDIILYK